MSAQSTERTEESPQSPPDKEGARPSGCIRVSSSTAPAQDRRLVEGSDLGQPEGRVSLATDLLILSDGTVLAHNLTPGMAAVLHQINPEDETMKVRGVPARERLASSTADRRVGTPELGD